MQSERWNPIPKVVTVVIHTNHFWLEVTNEIVGREMGQFYQQQQQQQGPYKVIA